MGLADGITKGEKIMPDMRNVTMFRQRATPDTASSGSTIDTARVVRVDDGEFLLLTPDTLALRGKKAAGCLLEPELNDTVLIVRNTPEGVFILTVLERGGGVSRIILNGDTTLCATGGSLRLSGDTIELTAEKSATLDAPDMKLQGVRGDASFLNFSLTASVAEAKAGKLSLVASSIDTVAERITQRVRDCFRWVSRMDQTKAGQVSISAENRFDVKADAAALIADGDVKIDGDKIRLG